MDKPVLYFYTNMPTPYQLDFFDALVEHFNLTVVYFSARERDRLWDLSTKTGKYNTIILKDNILARVIQHFIPSFHFSNKIHKITKYLKVDFAVINGTYWSPNVLLALRYNKSYARKTAWWGEPLFPVKNSMKNKIKRVFITMISHNTDILLAIGRKAIECYRDYGYKKPIYNIPYNINNSLFEPDALQQSIVSELQAKYKTGEEIIFLSSGSLIHRKGMDTIIQAFLMLPKFYNVRLLILGDGIEKEKLMKLTKLDKRIEFLGFQEKETIPYWFSLADVFLFASRYDGWGLVINEAMAAKKAIICSFETGAAYDSLVHRENALLYQADDTVGFTKGIIELIEDKELRQKLAVNANRKGFDLSSNNMAKRMYDIYRMDQ